MTNEYDYDGNENQAESISVETVENTSVPVTNVNAETNASMTPTGQRLRAYFDRIERLEEDKKAVMEDIKEVFGEAKGDGFDVKAMRKILALRKKDADERAEEEAIIETYMAALGMH